MSNSVNITISKILNWTSPSQNIRLQIGFYSKNSGSYVAHKTVTAYNHKNVLSINTSFNINYLAQHRFIIIRLSSLEGENQSQIGQIQIDLNLLKDKQLLYIPFSHYQNILEVKLYSAKPKLSPSVKERSSTNRDRFLQQRNDFIDKLNDHESQLKKKFSEKVYNLLKDIKNRGSLQSKERERSKGSKNKNQLDFRTRLSAQKKKPQGNKRDGLPEVRNPSPTNKLRLQNQLLINSMKSKQGTEDEHGEFTNELIGIKQKMQANRKYGDRNNLRKTAFGGLLQEESRK